MKNRLTGISFFKNYYVNKRAINLSGINKVTIIVYIKEQNVYICTFLN